MNPTLLILLLTVAASLTGCAAPDATSPSEPMGGAVFIDSADLLIMESYPVQISLHIVGNLPTPCHEFWVSVGQPDDKNRIDATAWSESDPAAICAQVLQPFEENVSIPIAGQEDGTYSVWLNGELIGEFNYPG
ncbi:MAG: hypothetical protein WD740_04205 [Anaerolineales bacterium]